MIANGDTTPLDNSSLRIYFLLELFILLRLVRIKKIMATSEVMRGLWERINIEIALSMKFIFMIALISHWIACIWGLIAYIEAGTFGDGLLNNLNWISNWVEESYVSNFLCRFLFILMYINFTHRFPYSCTEGETLVDSYSLRPFPLYGHDIAMMTKKKK